jgi:hypothetical protein
VVGTTTMSTGVVTGTNIPVTIPVGSTAVTLNFGGTAPATGALTATCAAGTEVNAGVCKTPAPWYASVVVLPAEVTHPGITAAVNKLPPGCTTQTQACWRDTLVAGIIKPIATGLVYSGRRIIAVPFFRPEGNYKVAMLYEDDFSPADSGSLTAGGTDGNSPAWYRGVVGGLMIPSITFPGNCFIYGPTEGGSWGFGVSSTCPSGVAPS